QAIYKPNRRGIPMIETTGIEAMNNIEVVSGVPVSEEGAPPFEEVNRVLTKWFYKPDLQAIRIVMGTMQSHYLGIGNGWLFIVAPPGTGKTTMSIMDSANLPQVISLGDFSENTFISGFVASPTPGILEQLGTQQYEGTTVITEGDAIFLAKDFTT